jgi:DNA-directed RNA polymerase subunit L
MKITILEKKKSKLFFEVEADHTLCNVLKKELWNDKKVTVSGYTKEHIQVGYPKFMLEVSSGDPQKVLLEAVKRLKKNNVAFLKAFKVAK